jgi:lipoprotein-releasing system permease protein
MKFSSIVAFRYLFDKKSTNAIHIISRITVGGLAIGTAAFIIILSVFNGFRDLVGGMYSAFNPPIKVQPLRGKVFVPSAATMQQLKNIKGIKAVCGTLQETALFGYNDFQALGLLKGVESNFLDVVRVDTMIMQGEYQITESDNRSTIVMAKGLMDKLNFIMDSRFTQSNDPIKVYMPKRENKKGMGFSSILDAKPFTSRLVYPRGSFDCLQEYSHYCMAPIGFVRELLGYNKGELSFIEISPEPNYDLNTLKKDIQEVMGPDFDVLNRVEQNSDFFKSVNLEKWFSYAIITLTLLLVSLNLVGALFMMVIEKQRDISLLQALGATQKDIQLIFIKTGLLLTIMGLGLGFVIGTSLCLLQIQFGLVQFQAESGTFLVNHYPVKMELLDFALVLATTLGLGFFASWYPSLRAATMPINIKTD